MKRFHIPRVSLIGLVIAAMLLVSVLPSAIPAKAAASLTLDRTTVPQGASVGVSGNGFTAQDTVVVYIDAPVLTHTQRIQTSTTTDGNGTVATHLNLPRGIASGTYTVTAKDTHGITGTQRLTVLDLIVLRPDGSTPVMTVVDRHGFFVDALGFKSGEPIAIQATYPTYSGNDIVQNRTATADSKGNVYTVSMYAPNGVKIGWSTLTATGQTSNTKASGRVWVTYNPFIFLNHNIVAAGSPVEVQGRGFVANTQVRVQISFPGNSGTSQTLTVTSQADTNGNFTKWFRVPAYVSSGTYTVVATGVTSGLKREAKLTVNQKPVAKSTPTPKPTATPTPKPTAAPTPKPTAAPTPKPTAAPTFHATSQLFPSVTLPNQHVSIAGQGFPPNVSVVVSVTFGLTDGSSRHIVKYPVSDGNGNFATAFRVPYKTAPAVYSVTAATSKARATDSLQVLPLSAQPKNLSFQWLSLWYHTVRQGTWDYVDIQSGLKTQLGIWAHVIFPSGQHLDYYTNTDQNGHWAIRFSIPKRGVSSHSNAAYITVQLWHGKQTTQSFLDFALV